MKKIGLPENMDKISDNFMIIFAAHKDQLYNYIVRIVNDREIAKDISQEVFVRLYSNLKNGANINNSIGWLLTIARNLSLNRIRDKKKEIPLENGEDHDCPANQNTDPRYMALEKAMNNLEPRYRELIILKEYEGFSYEEISKITNTTLAAVKTALYKARIQLKENYEAITIGGNKYVL